jgi:ubiquitin-protein ligase
MNPPTGFKHKVTDNLQRWIIEVIGAPGTLYANDTYQLQVDFPEHYPMESPQVIFLHPAPLHPHIYSNGHICLGMSLCPLFSDTFLLFCWLLSITFFTCWSYYVVRMINTQLLYCMISNILIITM